MAVSIFLLEMEDLYITYQCGNLSYLLTHIHPPNSLFTCVTLEIQENCLWNKHLRPIFKKRSILS